MNGKQKSKKRCRTRFNSWQVQRLEEVFLKTHYPDTQQMEGLASQTKIPTVKMQIWFQNRRAKWRKNSRLKNFGGLASVKETEYVPAPHITDTLKSFALENHLENYRKRLTESRCKENSGLDAMDLRIGCLSDCKLSPKSVPEMVEKSNAYKNSGGITSTRLSEQMNAFEYPTAYYSRHYTDNKEMPVMPFPFASNQTMTSLLFAPKLSHLYSLHIQSDFQSTDYNK